MKKIISLILLSGIFITVYGGTFTSQLVGPSAWNNPATWSYVGDADGIPDSDDDVTISLTHTVSGNVVGACRHLTIAGTLNVGASMVLSIYGNYTVTGTEGGSGAIIFYSSAGTNISGAGSFGVNVRYTFAAGSNRVIIAGTTITKNVAVGIANATVINSGTVTLTTVNTNPGATWINNNNLTLKSSGFMSGRTFTANASGTVTLNYTSGSIPTTTAGYYNLIVGPASGTKSILVSTVVVNDLTINVNNTLNTNGFDLSVGGNWFNAGTFTAGVQTVTFNGTSTVSGASATSFNNVIISGTLTGHATSMNVGGNWTNNGTFTHNNGTIVFNGTTTVSGGSATTFYNVTISGTLTGHATSMSVARNFVNNGTYTHNSGTVVFNGTTTISGSSTTSFSDVSITGTLTGSATMNVAGNWSNAGTYTHNSGTVVFNGTTTVSGGSTTTFNNVTITGTLTGHATNMILVGNYVNNGTFNNNAGTVSFNGIVAQTISGTSSTAFENLTVNNTVGAGSGVSISGGTYTLGGVLTLSNGTLSTGGNSFTMLSTALKTARIATIAGTGAISGNFTIQRYITGRTANWADLASPVQASTFGDWASELPAISYNYSSSAYPTQWTYDETADDFSPVTAAGTALTPGKGYEVFLSGDYNYGNLPNTTINTVGVPNQGNKSYGNPIVTFNSAGSNLVANPFASPISWNLVLAASVGLTGTIDMYDNASGNYATFGAGTIIPPTQGFWVYANAAPTLNIPEAAKVADPGNTQIRSAIEEPYFTLRLAANDNTFYHVLKINASSDASDGWDGNDHPFRKSLNKTAPSIYSMIEGKKSVINTFNSSNEMYSMPLTTNVGVSGNYKIKASGFEFMSEYTSVKLEDKFLNKIVDLIKESDYSFKMNVGDKSDRFIVHFSKNKDSEILTGGNTFSDFINQVEILPTTQGNIINFNLSETTNTTISVTNLIGQVVTDMIAVAANSQSVNVTLPEGFKGMYIIRVESAKGSINKKFVKR